MEGWLHNMEWIGGIRSEMLTPLFKGFTLLGYSGFLLIFIPLGYWLISKRIFAQVCLLLLISAILNAYLKDFFRDPRPDLFYRLDPHVGKSYGFPSGHAQMAVAVWFWMAWQARKKWVWVLSSIVVAGICFSRLYLGVHDPEDVFGGIAIGLLSIFLFKFLTSSRFEWWHRQSPVFPILTLILIELSFFLTWPGSVPEKMLEAGILLVGFWTGVLIERKTIHFERHHDWWRVILAGVVGMVSIGLLQKGFEFIGSQYDFEKDVFAFGESFILGVYVAVLAPWVFQMLRLVKMKNQTHLTVSGR